MGQQLTTAEKRDKAKALVINDGIRIREACKRVGMHVSTYYAKPKGDKQVTSKPKIKRRKLKLTVHDIPMLPIESERLFMVFGSPKTLSHFAKAFS